MKTEGRYANTGDLTVVAGDTNFVKIEITEALRVLQGWQLGISSDFLDVPGLRVSVQLHAGAAPEIISSFLYYSPGRSAQGYPVSLKEPYKLEEGEKLYLFLRIRNGTSEDVVVRANAFLYFLVEEVVP